MTTTVEEYRVTQREIDLNQEVRKLWGKQWNEPEVEYEFSNGRKFVRKTEDLYE